MKYFKRLVPYNEGLEMDAKMPLPRFDSQSRQNKDYKEQHYFKGELNGSHEIIFNFNIGFNFTILLYFYPIFNKVI